MKGVGAGPRIGQDGSASTLAILGGKGRGQHLDLFRRVRRGNQAVGAVDANIAGQAINDDRVRNWPSPTEGEIVDVGVVLARAGCPCEGLADQELICALGAGAFRQIDELAGIEFAAYLWIGVVQGTGCIGYGDDLGICSDSQLSIDDQVLVQYQIQFVGVVLSKSALLEANRIAAGLQKRNAVASAPVGHRLIFSCSAAFAHRNHDAWHNSPAWIGDDAADRSVNSLGAKQVRGNDEDEQQSQTTEYPEKVTDSSAPAIRGMAIAE